MVPMIDEAALRRPTFRDGHKITLANGQEWTIPKPRLRLRPRFEGGKAKGFNDLPSWGGEDDELVDTLFGVGEVDGAAWVEARFELLARLLLANYDLADDQLADLLTIDRDDPATEERWAEITRVLRGLTPKLSPAT